MNYKILISVPEGHKYCYHCGQIKPLDGFHKHGAGYHSWCKVCRSPLTPPHSNGKAHRSSLPRECNNCHRVLPLSEFHRHKGNPQGKSYTCKVCSLDSNLEWREGNRSSLNETARLKYWTKLRRCTATKARVKGRGLEMKRTVLTHYGRGKLACVCCGESIIELLTLDHVNNDGARHRKELNLPGGGRKFYFWLIEHGFPAGYQTLCFSCNIGKHIAGGVCPHQKIVKDLIMSVEAILG